MKPLKNKTETATFGAGCFWHVEHAFSKLDGVLKTQVGYMGGDESSYPNPTYEQVCTNKTGYAEVIQIEFDSKKISYEQLLELFWKIHDPTTLNRQGNDLGTQYKSIIFYHNKEQKKKAEDSKIKQQKTFKDKIVTETLPAKTFFKAEEYHQKYIEKGGVCLIL